MINTYRMSRPLLNTIRPLASYITQFTIGLSTMRLKTGFFPSLLTIMFRPLLNTIRPLASYITQFTIGLSTMRLKTGFFPSLLTILYEFATIFLFGLLPVPVLAADDSTPPAAINDLAVSSPSHNSVTLTWTAPGDDGTTGQASQYDIRYSTANITDSNFDSATAVPSPPSPQTPGSSENITVGGLNPETTYFFALKTADEVPSWSAISNTPTATTTSAPVSDSTPPAAVTNLAVSSPSSSSVTLTWTAPGDDGTTGTRGTTGGTISTNPSNKLVAYR